MIGGGNMKAREVVKDILLKKNLSNVEFAKVLDITPTALWDRLNTKKAKDIPVSLLNEMLKPLGYKIMITPSETPIGESDYVIGENESN